MATTMTTITARCRLLLLRTPPRKNHHLPTDLRGALDRTATSSSGQQQLCQLGHSCRRNLSTSAAAASGDDNSSNDDSDYLATMNRKIRNIGISAHIDRYGTERSRNMPTPRQRAFALAFN
jgi:hypothetical protein